MEQLLKIGTKLLILPPVLPVHLMIIKHPGPANRTNMFNITTLLTKSKMFLLNGGIAYPTLSKINFTIFLAVSAFIESVGPSF